MIISKELIIKFSENYNKSFEMILSADALITLRLRLAKCSEHGVKYNGDGVKPNQAKPSEATQTEIRMKNGR